MQPRNRKNSLVDDVCSLETSLGLALYLLTRTVWSFQTEEICAHWKYSSIFIFYCLFLGRPKSLQRSTCLFLPVGGSKLQWVVVMCVRQSSSCHCHFQADSSSRTCHFVCAHRRSWLSSESKSRLGRTEVRDGREEGVQGEAGEEFSHSSFTYVSFPGLVTWHLPPGKAVKQSFIWVDWIGVFSRPHLCTDGTAAKT